MNRPSRHRYLEGKALLYIVTMVAVVSAAAFAHLHGQIRTRSCPAAADICINNLRQFEGATVQWALENRKDTNEMPQWSEIGPYMSKGIPSCPLGGKYALGTESSPPTCSIPGHIIP